MTTSHNTTGGSSGHQGEETAPQRSGSRARKRFGRLRVALATVVAVVVAGMGVQALASPGTSEDEPPVPELAWAPCEEQSDYECATAQVPLDYRQPQGRTIDLAVTRRKATDEAQRIGTLFLQPGGPGNSGVDFVRNNYASLPAKLRDRFDVFGYDVRGVGRSSQLQCLNDKQYLQAMTENEGVPGPDAYDRAVQTAADFDQACADNAGELLPYVGTEYVARDIDLLRQALGEDQLTFYGRSFGTYIGTVYAAVFPDRVRALALDGAYDPEHYANQPYAYDQSQYLALDRSMNQFLTWCAANESTCGFGDGNPRAAFTKLKKDLDDNPVTTASDGQANGFTLAFRLLFNLNEGKVLWPAIGEALDKAQQGDNTSFLLQPPSAASFDFLTPNVVVECVDRDYPTDLAKLKQNVMANIASAPLLGPPVGLSAPFYDHQHAPTCVQWSAERVSRYDGSYRAAGSAPILVLGTTGDPDTPYEDAVALTRQLDNARLLTFEAEGHTAFGRSVCATDAVTAYLTDLTLPPVGKTCADEPQPTPATPNANPEGTTLAELLHGVSDSRDRLGVLR